MVGAREPVRQRCYVRGSRRVAFDNDGCNKAVPEEILSIQVGAGEPPLNPRIMKRKFTAAREARRRARERAGMPPKTRVIADKGGSRRVEKRGTNRDTERELLREWRRWNITGAQQNPRSQPGGSPTPQHPARFLMRRE